MTTGDRKAYLVGGGIGSLAAAAFMIRDGGLPGGNITIYEALPVLGGSLDGGGNPDDGYTLRGGRMLTTDNYECTWGLFKSIPSLVNPGKTVFDETVEFNEKIKAHSQARLVDRNRAIVDVTSMGFSMTDRMELAQTHDGRARRNWVRPDHRLALAGVLHDQVLVYVGNDLCLSALAQRGRVQALSAPVHQGILPHRNARGSQAHGLQSISTRWFDRFRHGFRTKGVNFQKGCLVTDFDLASEAGKVAVRAIKVRRAGNSETETVAIGADDLVFFQNGSMTDASSFGSMTRAPEQLTKEESGGWTPVGKTGRRPTGVRQSRRLQQQHSRILRGNPSP